MLKGGIFLHIPQKILHCPSQRKLFILEDLFFFLENFKIVHSNYTHTYNSQNVESNENDEWFFLTKKKNWKKIWENEWVFLDLNLYFLVKIR
jgi:hypothetical protein